MRPLVAQFGESVVNEHAVQVLGYPAVLCQTTQEAIQVQQSILKSKHKE